VTAPRPYNLVAELTYRCPLRCPYCSNPLDYRGVSDGLDAEAWSRLFAEAAALGVLHVGLSGGEPGLRGDLREIVGGAARAGLYTHLVTAGLPLDADGLAALRKAGLESVQLSVQDARPEPSNAMAGAAAFERKLAFARAARGLGLPLTLNVVLHRGNLERVAEIVALAAELDADRLELANVQMHGWALANRAALLPTRAQLDAAARDVARARRERRRPEILFVLPDYYADRPKPCMGGWGRSMMVVAPDGRVLPCHGAAALPGLEFWRFGDRSLADCWAGAPGMNAFRGLDWMTEPCRSCPERERDFGGCRCQAFALAGDASATDPACALAPAHDRVRAARAVAEAPAPTPTYRGSSPQGGR
jgi:pyrroloquinoline quinone biosynthesis protein E